MHLVFGENDRGFLKEGVKAYVMAPLLSLNSPTFFLLHIYSLCYRVTWPLLLFVPPVSCCTFIIYRLLEFLSFLFSISAFFVGAVIFPVSCCPFNLITISSLCFTHCEAWKSLYEAGAVIAINLSKTSDTLARFYECAETRVV